MVVRSEVVGSSTFLATLIGSILIVGVMVSITAVLVWSVSTFL